MKLVVPPALDGARVDKALAELADLPRNAVRRLCETARVRVVSQGRAKSGDRVRAGDVLEVAGGGAWLVPSPLVVPVLLETPELLVVDKPRGINCHPLVPGEGGTVVDALVALHPEIAGASADPREGGLVHRLDTDTSGALAVARTRAAHERVRALFDEGGVEKLYLTWVEGELRSELVIDDPIDHDPSDPRRMITGAGRDARTVARPLRTNGGNTLVEIAADRGRRHQVRVHLAHAGHPLVGDALYGAHSEGGHALHAWQLAIPGFPRVTAPPPPGLS